MASIARLIRERGGTRRRIIRLPRIRPKLNELRELQAIIREMVAAVFAHKDELIAAATAQAPALYSMDGQIIGVLRDSIEDIDRLISLIVTQSQHVMVRLEARVRGWGKSMDTRHERDFVGGVLTSTKIDIATQLHPAMAERTVGHYVTWSTSLIRDVGDEARRRLANAVLEGVRTRTPPRELARVIQGIEDMSYRRAKNIAADQSNKLNAALGRARQQEAGITAFTWIHSGAAHPRVWHLERDGDVFQWDDNDIDPGDYPGEPPFCGCVAQATIVNEEGDEIQSEQEVDQEG